MNLLFSIIIPVYNVAPYLRECLDSVLVQTLADWEAICVDDGSTDGSGAILDEYAEKDNRMKVIHQKNNGVSAARNVAMDIAAGEWITFLDSDDRIDPFRLQTLYAIARNNVGVDWIHETKHAANTRLVHLEVESSFDLVSDDVFLAGWSMLKQDALLVLNTYKRICIADIRFPEGVRYAEDDIFELRCVPHCKGLAVAGYCGYWYRNDREDAASRRVELEDSVKIHQLLLDMVAAQKDSIDKVNDLGQFAVLFTRTVRKDFDRVFRQFRRAPLSVQDEHRAIARKIYESPYFSAWHTESCRIGYWFYMKRGWLMPIQIQDFFVRGMARLGRFIQVFGRLFCVRKELS
ncbi:MAG: glycosyltransferase [Kiritimatiellae bacterium]|nr:glycosyltransferase [Kiritimatiellia bacterium]